MEAHTALDANPSPGEPNPPEIQHPAVLGASGQQGYSQGTLQEGSHIKRGHFPADCSEMQSPSPGTAEPLSPQCSRATKQLKTLLIDASNAHRLPGWKSAVGAPRGEVLWLARGRSSPGHILPWCRQKFTPRNCLNWTTCPPAVIPHQALKGFNGQDWGEIPFSWKSRRDQRQG